MPVFLIAKSSMSRGLSLLAVVSSMLLTLTLGEELPQTNLLMIMFDDLRTELK